MSENNFDSNKQKEVHKDNDLKKNENAENIKEENKIDEVKKKDEVNKSVKWLIFFLILGVIGIILQQVGKKGMESTNQTEEVDKSVEVVSVEVADDSKEKNDLDSKYIEGEHYEVVNEVMEIDNVEGPYIIEYLWLGCEHCQNFAKVINAYKDANPDTHVEYRHAANMERWSLDARIFYALKETGNFSHFQDLLKFYERMRKEHQKLPDYNDISEFLVTKDIDPERFFNVADSELVLNYIEASLNDMRKNEITGVPTVIVSGKYKINPQLPSNVRSQEDYNELVNYLLNKK